VGQIARLGTGLGLIIGAKLAAPENSASTSWATRPLAATGLDFETAVRCGIPITTVVFNNSAMAIERHAWWYP
jgi:acetolactate synthase-1/2/3 large subunit